MSRLEVGFEGVYRRLQFGRHRFGRRIMGLERVLNGVHRRQEHIRYGRVMGISEGGSTLHRLFNDLLVDRR